MTKGSFEAELERKATRAMVTRAFYRWESAVVVALTVGLAVLSLAGLLPAVLPFWQWWFWLVLGVAGEAGLIWSSLRDPEFRARAVADMFREDYPASSIKDGPLRAQVERALDYRDRIDDVIDRSQDGVLREHLKDVSRGVTAWMENLFRLAQRLDAYAADEAIHRDLASVEPAIAELKKRLAAEDDDAVKRQLSQAIAQRQIQRDNLRTLQNVMEQAQLQLENTLTAMGTLYSQMVLLGAKDVASGRAQRLQKEIGDQVQALQDIVHTMDEVYGAGVAPTGSMSVGIGPQSGRSGA